MTETTPASIRCAGLAVALLAALACQGSPLADARESDALIEKGLYEEAERAAGERVKRLEASDGHGSAVVAASAEALIRALIANGRAAAPETLMLAQRTLQSREAILGADHPDLVPSLLNLGDALAAAGDFDKAIAIARRAVSLRERSGGVDSPGLAGALDHLGRALLIARRHDEALRVLEQSLAQKEEGTAANDVGIARTLEDIGLVLQRMGTYDASGPLLRRALTIQETVNPKHPAYATTLNLIAQQFWFEGDIQASKRASEHAVQLAEETLRPDHPVVALSLRYLAATLFDLGESGRSRSLTERALAIAERNFGPNHHVTAEYLNDLGFTELDEGNYTAARRRLQQALEIYEARYGRFHEYVATTLSVLARVDARMGDYATARREQSRALDIYAKVGGPNHPFVAIALTELATVYRDQGLPLEALPLLERALAIREKNLGPGHRDVARTLADLAATLAQTGRSTRAQALAKRSLGIWERLGVPDAPEHATVLSLSAELETSHADYRAAQEHYEKALQIRAKVFGTAHPLYAEAQSGLGRALAGLGERQAALETAASAETAGRDHLRLMLRSLPERQALNYAAARPRGLNLVLSLAGVMPAAVPSALDGVIRGRALVLDEIAGRRSTIRQVSEQADPAHEALRSAQQRLANLTVRGPGALSPTQYAAILEQARRESEAAEETLAERSASYRTERTRDQLGLDDVGRALADGAVLVSFVQYDRISEVPAGTPTPSSQAETSSRAEPSYLAFVLRPKRSPVAIPLGSVRAIDRLVSRWRADIAGEAVTMSAPPSSVGMRSARSSGAALRRAVWDPVLRHLAQPARVFIVPDGALSLVPFAALPIGRDAFVLETAPPIHYLSAERDIVSMARGGTSSGILALGGPAFDNAPVSPGPPTTSLTARETATETAPLRNGRTACASLQSLQFHPLEGTLQEVQEVSRFWPAPLGAARALIGREASERTFKQDASHYRVLHLATHGFFLDGSCLPESPAATTRGVGGLSTTMPVDNPLRLSGLALAGANRRALAGPDEDDGILTAEEVASLDLQGVEWAVLSACDTGVGEIKAGEGVFGLRRAFQVAGARTVVMSLWSVDDQATRAWMRALYEGRFQNKLSTADAVHQASLNVLRERRARGQSTHPFYWAAFVAAGDWR